MADIQVRAVACDKCKRHTPDVDVTTYQVQTPAGKYRVDLCTDDAAPLEDLLRLVRPRPVKSRIQKVPIEALPSPMKKAPASSTSRSARR